MDAFFLYSLTWAFGSLLNLEGRSEFNMWLLTVLKDNDAMKEAKKLKKDGKGDDESQSESARSDSENESLAT